MSDDDYQDEEEEWISEEKSESWTFDLTNTLSPWRLPSFPSESRRPRLPEKQNQHRHRRKFLVGFRGWLVRGNFICPAARPVAWPHCEPVHAMCAVTANHHVAPAVGCGCGLWAFKDPQTAFTKFRPYTNNQKTVAMGAVAMWGRVFEHKHGYRAEWAYPLTLELYGCSDDQAAVLEEAYAIPVTHIVHADKTDSAPPKLREGPYGSDWELWSQQK